MDLKNKTLLLMGGGAYARDIATYKQETEFRCECATEKITISVG